MRLLREEEGLASVEYVLIVGIIAVGCVIAVIGLGPLLVAQLRFVRAWLLLPVA